MSSVVRKRLYHGEHGGSQRKMKVIIYKILKFKALWLSVFSVVGKRFYHGDRGGSQRKYK